MTWRNASLDLADSDKCRKSVENMGGRSWEEQLNFSFRVTQARRERTALPRTPFSVAISFCPLSANLHCPPTSIKKIIQSPSKSFLIKWGHCRGAWCRGAWCGGAWYGGAWYLAWTAGRVSLKQLSCFRCLVKAMSAHSLLCGVLTMMKMMMMGVLRGCNDDDNEDSEQCINKQGNFCPQAPNSCWWSRQTRHNLTNCNVHDAKPQHTKTILLIQALAVLLVLVVLLTVIWCCKTCTRRETEAYWHVLTMHAMHLKKMLFL